MCYNYIQFPAQRGIFPGNFWLAFKDYILGIKKTLKFYFNELYNYVTQSRQTKSHLAQPVRWNGGEHVAAEQWCCSQPEPGSREGNLFLQQNHGKNKAPAPTGCKEPLISSTHDVSASWCSTRIKMPLRQSQLLLPALWNSWLHGRCPIPC